MAQTNNIHMYVDVATVLDSALAAGGAVYELEDRKAAIRFRFRAYYYRSLLMKHMKSTLPEGVTARTPYDHLTINLEGNSCRIELIKPTGRLKNLEGKPIDFVSPNPDTAIEATGEGAETPEEKALLEEAKRLMQNLGVE